MNQPLTAAPEDTDLLGAGRPQPRPPAPPEGFRHDVRFNGAVGGLGISVYCQPCHWGVWIDDRHDLPDLIVLVAMHGGLAACKSLVIDTLARYGAEHDEPALAVAL